MDERCGPDCGRPAPARGLRGKERLFAGAKARAKRETALRAAGAIGPSLEWIGEAEVRAERTYRTGVDAQHAADATGFPRLPAAAETAIGIVAAAPGEKARAGAWRAVQRMSVSRVSCGPSVPPLSSGSERRACAPCCGLGRPGSTTAASVAPGQPPELNRVAELTATKRVGERASASLAQRQAESER